MESNVPALRAESNTKRRLEMDLESLGITREQILNAVVEKISEQLMLEDSYDGENPPMNK